MTSTLFRRIERIFCLGYRNFLLMKLPPLDRTPANQKRASGPLPNATMIEWYNDALSNYSELFQRSHPDAKVMVFDTTKFLNHVLDDPALYGIENTTDYCPAFNQPKIDSDPSSYGCQSLDKYLLVTTMTISRM
jgi:phospholipase/lecithinase/hemolysin